MVRWHSRRSCMPTAYVGKDQDTIGYWGGAICCLQMIPLLGSIIPVERGLKKTFDKYGNRR